MGAYISVDRSRVEQMGRVQMILASPRGDQLKPESTTIWQWIKLPRKYTRESRGP